MKTTLLIVGVLLLIGAAIITGGVYYGVSSDAEELRLTCAKHGLVSTMQTKMHGKTSTQWRYCVDSKGRIFDPNFMQDKGK